MQSLPPDWLVNTWLLLFAVLGIITYVVVCTLGPSSNRTVAAMDTATNAATRPNAAPRPPGEARNIVVCCDGTWCGHSAGTHSNVQIIAELFSRRALDRDEVQLSGVHVFPANGSNYVRYAEGVGAFVKTGNWLDKVWEGLVATDIKEHCIGAYRFIAEHYRPGDKVWLFGLSRGAHTVRCVAGIINKCGILQTHPDGGVPAKVPVPPFSPDASLQRVCERAYSLFISDRVKPNSSKAMQFVEKYSYAKGTATAPPIRFMGLFDTVGALGVPKLIPGSSRSLSYEFYDTHVSSEVEEVFQALALDDQLTFFTPCRVDPWDPTAAPRHYTSTRFIRDEIWYPGAHFDLGRQNWILDAVVNGGLLETLQPKIKYTPALANPPLVEMVNRIHRADNSAPQPNTGIASMDPNHLPQELLENNIPWNWAAEETAQIPLVKPYQSVVVPKADRDPDTGMIHEGLREQYLGVYARYLRAVLFLPEVSSWVGGFFKNLPFFGGFVRAGCALPEFLVYLAVQLLLTDRQPQPESGDVINWG